jgi:1,2-phenylacetyl-CoA epoxidase catalytic subunit
MANPADTLQRVYDNYSRIWLMLTEIIANPNANQQAIDTLTATAQGLGVVRPKIDYSLDGESYNWTAYQAQLENIMAGVRRQMVFANGPFEIHSVGR